MNITLTGLSPPLVFNRIIWHSCRVGGINGAPKGEYRRDQAFFMTTAHESRFVRARPTIKWSCVKSYQVGGRINIDTMGWLNPGFPEATWRSCQVGVNKLNRLVPGSRSFRLILVCSLSLGVWACQNKECKWDPAFLWRRVRDSCVDLHIKMTFCQIWPGGVK